MCCDRPHAWDSIREAQRGQSLRNGPSDCWTAADLGGIMALPRLVDPLAKTASQSGNRPSATQLRYVCDTCHFVPNWLGWSRSGRTVTNHVLLLRTDYNPGNSASAAATRPRRLHHLWSGWPLAYSIFLFTIISLYLLEHEVEQTHLIEKSRAEGIVTSVVGVFECLMNLVDGFNVKLMKLIFRRIRRIFCWHRQHVCPEARAFLLSLGENANAKQEKKKIHLKLSVERNHEHE